MTKIQLSDTAVKIYNYLLSNIDGEYVTILTYGDVAKVVDLIPRSHELISALRDISVYTHQEYGCMLSAMVVGGDTGIPGSGFYKLAVELKEMKDLSKFDRDTINDGLIECFSNQIRKIGQTDFDSIGIKRVSETPKKKSHQPSVYQLRLAHSRKIALKINDLRKSGWSVVDENGREVLSFKVTEDEVVRNFIDGSTRTYFRFGLHGMDMTIKEINDIYKEWSFIDPVCNFHNFKQIMQ